MIYNDVLGDKIGEESQKAFKKQQKFTEKRLAKLNRERDKILKDKTPNEERLDYLNNSIQELGSAQQELVAMEKDEKITFHIEYRSPEELASEGVA